MRSLFLLALSIFIFSCQSAPPVDRIIDKPDGWQLIFKHDEEGNSIGGSKEELIQAIRSGYSVRIGWGWERERDGEVLHLEHIATPLYLSIIKDDLVSAIIDAHPLLESYIDENNQAFSESGHYWQCVMTSAGTFNARVYHRGSGKLLKDWPQRHILSWFVEYPSTPSKSPSPPLYQTTMTEGI